MYTTPTPMKIQPRTKWIPSVNKSEIPKPSIAKNRIAITKATTDSAFCNFGVNFSSGIKNMNTLPNTSTNISARIAKISSMISAILFFFYRLIKVQGIKAAPQMVENIRLGCSREHAKILGVLQLKGKSLTGW